MSLKTNSYEEKLLLLKKLEGFISSKAQAIKNCRYAFAVILPEEKYTELVDLYQNTGFYNYTDKFPWCHLKLLTETYVRHFKKQSKEYSLENLLAETLNIESISYWYQIPKIIEKLKLKRVREEGGPWYIYANVLLHAGVPAAYFRDIHGIVEANFKYSNKDVERTINNLCDHRDIFKYHHFSKYFKLAFEAPTEKKILFKWFTNLVALAYHGFDLATDSKDYLPPHLINFIKEQDFRDSKDDETTRQKQFREKASPGSGLRFNPDKGCLEYHLELNKEDLSTDRIDLKTDFDLPQAWKTEVEKVKKRKSLNLILPIKPSDLDLDIFYRGKRTKIFDTRKHGSIQAIIFDSNFNIISPKQSTIEINKENDAQITLIMRNENRELQERFKWFHLDDLSGEWWNWHHYEWEINSLEKPLLVRFPEPYGEIQIYARYIQSDITGNWVSDAELSETAKVKQFGGDEPPQFIIKSEFFDRENKPILFAKFSDGNSLVPDKGILAFKKDCWIWRSSLNSTDLPKFRYLINLKVYGMSIGSSAFAEFSCFWYPSIRLELMPDHLLWPSDRCMVSLRGNELLDLNNNLYIDINDNLISKKGRDFVWAYLRKPQNCMPVITVQEKGFIFEFNVKLPYLDIWIQTELQDEIEPNSLEWSDDKPFARSIIEDLAKKDYKARIRFRSWSKEKKLLYLYDSQTNNLIKKLSFEQGGYDSMSCVEILKFNEPIIRDNETNRDAYLFKNEDAVWSFKSIYENVKKKQLYGDDIYHPKLKR